MREQEDVVNEQELVLATDTKDKLTKKSVALLCKFYTLLSKLTTITHSRATTEQDNCTTSDGTRYRRKVISERSTSS